MKDFTKHINRSEVIKVGNANFSMSIEKGPLGKYNWFVHKDGAIVSGGTEDTEDLAKKKGEEALKREKTGNSKVGNETYQHKLYPDKYVIIEGKNYKIVTDGKVEKSGELTDAVLYGINQTYKRVVNSKIDFAKHISVGNIREDAKAKKLFEEMMEAKKLAEDWGREINRKGDTSYEGSRKDAEEHYRKLKKEYEAYAMNDTPREYFSKPAKTIGPKPPRVK